MSIHSASFDHTARLWDADAGTCLHVLRRHTEPVYSITFSPSGHHIATGSFDKRMCVYDTLTASLVREYKGAGDIFEVVWNGTQIAVCAGNKTVTIVQVGNLGEGVGKVEGVKTIGV